MTVTVGPEEFINTIFENLDENEHVLLGAQLTKGNGQLTFTHSPWSNKQLSKWKRSRSLGGIYFNVSTVCEPADGDEWRRRREDCIYAYVVVLDDIGTKVAEQPKIEPSYKLESSKGNFQWGYLIEPYDDLGKYEGIVAALGELGFTDKGAGGYTRLMRIPGSINTKPGRANFVSTVTDWKPERIFKLEELAVDLGVDLNNLNVKKQPTASRANGSLPNIEILDPMEAWLRDNGHVVDDTGGDFITIRCPWGGEHTDNDTAGYSPLGRGDGERREQRGFNCFHDHCKTENRNTRVFIDWAVTQGGPEVAVIDPLPWYQDRYIFVESGAEVADMYQRPHGGVWYLGINEWNLANYRRIRVVGRDEPILLKTAFLEHPNTRKARSFAYIPGEGGYTTQFSLPVVNTYVEPTHPKTDQEPKIFLEHMDYLLGDQKDLFLDWLAYKIQKPARRSYAIVMVADKAFGVGRSWIGHMLDRVLQGKVNSASLSQLIGKGTSGEQNFNDWGAGCQFLVVEEAKENMDPSDFFKGYEKFKQMIDMRPVKFRCNPKFGKTRTDYMYFNCLIFTNHSDAMIIPPEERRICVLENPGQRKEIAYYDRLEASLDSDEPQKVYWYLKRRDVSKFDHVYPPVTEAKMLMIEQSKSPAEEVKDLAFEKLAGDIVTQKILLKAIRDAARDLEYVKIENNAGGVGNIVWKNLGSLRLKNTNNGGARYTIDGKQEELRAIRNKGKWRVVDQNRNKQDLLDELNKNIGERFDPLKVPK